jgi:predicted SAM-dependent methyltransferase
LHSQLEPSERFRIMRIIFGGRTDEYDVHHTGLYFELLRDFLYEAGFGDIRRVEEFDLFTDASKLRVGGDLISLNVQALKPA